MKSRRRYTTLFLAYVSTTALGIFLLGCGAPTDMNGRAKTAGRAGHFGVPDTPESWIERGRYLLTEGEFGPAEKAFRSALRLNRNSLPAYKYLALTQMKSKHLSEAESTYRRALEIGEGDSELWTGYGYCLIDNGREDEALAAFRQSVVLHTDPAQVASARLGAAAILKRRGDLVGATAEIEKAATWNPQLRRLLEEN